MDSQDTQVDTQGQNSLIRQKRCHQLRSNCNNCQNTRLLNRWANFKSQPDVRTGSASVVLGGKLYVIGGALVSTLVNQEDGEEVLASVRVYNPKTNQWSQVAPMNQKRALPVAGVICGKIYVVGGENRDNDNDEVALRSGEVYCPKKNTWTPIANMKEPREGFVGGVICGRLYVTGGSKAIINPLNPDGEDDRGIRSGEVYDPKTNTWSSIAPMNTGRIDAMAGVICGRLYVVGGVDNFNNQGNEVYYKSGEVYNPINNKWSPIRDMPEKRIVSGSGIINNCLFIVGGYDGDTDTIVKKGFFYNPKTNRWYPIRDMNQARASAATGVICGRLYITGGVNRIVPMLPPDILPADQNEFFY